MNLKNDKIAISAHYMLYGAAHALRDYLINEKINKLLFFGLPFYAQRNVVYEKYEKGKKTKESNKKRIKLGVFDYVIDFFTVMRTFIAEENFNKLIAADPLICVSGIFLKKIGKFDQVVLYSIDFVPRRFQNRLLNFAYHKIEKFCVENADEVWNVSPRISLGRKKFLGISSNKYKQKVVPIGIWNKKTKLSIFKGININQIVFVGHLLEKQGVQVVIEALPLIIKKIPDIKFVVIGGGEYKKNLENLTDLLNLNNYVEFMGWEKDRERVNEALSRSSVAMATYKPEREKLNNFTYYADPTKIKDYLGEGLPIILTDVSFNARELEKRRCAIVVRYEKEDVARAIIKLMKNEKLIKEYRKNSFRYAKEFDWKKIFDKVLKHG